MFSMLINVAKYVLGSNNQLDEPNINDLIARIQDAKDNSEDYTAIDNGEVDKNPDGCFYKSGTVTTVTTDYVLVDKHYMCDAVNVNVHDLEPGNKVYYMAYQGDKTEQMKIRKIISVIDDNWDDDNDRDSSETPKNNDTTQAQTMKRSVVAKVMGRDGRQVYLEPSNISLNLDRVDSTFVPYIGDWLKLESLVEIDENSGDFSGEVLQVDRVQPLRSKLIVGNVTKWDSQTGAGSIDKDIVFNKGSCEPGYVPCVGDKVVTDSIESDQGIYTWRSLTVVPLNQVTPIEPISNSNTTMETITTINASHIHTNIDVLLSDKHGIVITKDLSFNLDPNEEQDLVVKIENTRNTDHILNRGCFMSKKSQSQLSLVSPGIDTITRINPTKSISYVFRVRGKFVGTTEELFIFIFKGFKIGRIFRITVNPKKSSYCGIQSFTRGKMEKLVTTGYYDKGTYIPGVRPCKPPSFIAVRSGIFRVPQRFWDAVLPSINAKRSQTACEIAVSEAIPCLVEGLRMENYTTRFHALLYLEEISRTIDMQRYDMESAILRPHGEYLCLTVPGLAEKRPSLIIGDKAIVSFNWDNTRGKLKYEGYVHRVKNSEVMLKFSEKFHLTYNSEECQVSFKCSYSSIGRCHAAINLAIINLGSEILFPSRVIEKEAQINFDIDPHEEKPKGRLRHNRSESFSSICSNTSLTSASDTSSDGTSRNPRVTVVERLFHQAKPLNGELADKSIKTTTSPESLNKYEKLATVLEPRKKRLESSNNNQSGNVSQNKIDPHVAQLKKRKIVWYNDKLNYHQKEAVRNILKGVARPLPYVIFGPPGTGKTITLCESVLQILTTIPESRLLIATPSNSAANLISERLLDSGVLKPGDLVRLVAQNYLHDDSIPERLLPFCATGDLTAEGSIAPNDDYESDKPKTNCTMSVLGRHRITVGTCIALGLLYNMGFPRGHFSHILVDEAGQATEPEIMVPLTFVHSSYGQIILAGDPMQLGPVVCGKIAVNFGLEESFLSRLLHQFPYHRDNEGFETGYDPRLVTKLVMNYRSLPEILELPNALFYESELIAQVSPTKSPEAQLVRSMAMHLPTRLGQSAPAIVFHGVNGENLQDPDSPSWYNPAEATQAYLYLLKLYQRGISGKDVGIITPYQKQVRQIRDLLFELDVELPKVGSVEEFQGQERKVIILSAVRSASNYVKDDLKHALGFIASPRRLNVAITRARALIIILGNPELLSQDPYWRSVLIYCIERGSYTGCNFLPSYLENGIDEADEDETSQ